MAIKEELQDDVKEDGGGKDELEALDALEKEAAEFNQVRPFSPPTTFLTIRPQDAEIDRIFKAFKLDAWVLFPHIHVPMAPLIYKTLATQS